MALRVAKVGGSLFSQSQWPAIVSNWLDLQPPMKTLLLAGGGRAVDTVRQAHGRHEICHVTAHWLAIRVMAVNSKLLAMQLPVDSRPILRLGDVERWVESNPQGLGIVDPESFLWELEGMGTNHFLPCGWHVTSDSIAAMISEVTAAAELVLLKSALPTNLPRLTHDEAAAIGYVDSYFPTAAQRIPRVRAVNLRASSFPDVELVRTSASLPIGI